MHALDALGLDPTADERAVKQAYAKRLKTTRPEDDPVAFQKLHETYTAALAYVRWRQEEADQEQIDSPAAHTVSPPGLLAGAEIITLDAVSPADGLGVEAIDVEFDLDPDQFTIGLFQHASTHDAASLRDWLDGESSAWPLSVKPAMAHHVLRHLLHNAPDITVAKLDVMVTAFGLDDVLTAYDPLGLDQVRQRLVEQEETRSQTAALRHWLLSGDKQAPRPSVSPHQTDDERKEEMRRLLRPANRAELYRHMNWTGNGAYPAWATRFFMGVLTGSLASIWARLLRPVPFVTRAVMAFLSRLDNGRYDGLAPEIEPKTVAFWEWAYAQRDVNKNRLMAACVIGGLLLMSFTLLQPPARRTQDGARAPSRQAVLQNEQEALRDYNAADQLSENQLRDKAIEAYTELTIKYKTPQTPLIEQIVVVAYYNRGYHLDLADKWDEARLAYADLERRWAGSDVPIVRRWVANGRVNLGNLKLKSGKLDEALAVFDRVIQAYIAIDSEDLGLQVAKALHGKAIVLRDLGRKPEARQAFTALQAVISRWRPTSKWQQPEIVAWIENASALLPTLD